jgi:hypothetical protein
MKNKILKIHIKKQKYLIFDLSRLSGISPDGGDIYYF